MSYKASYNKGDWKTACDVCGRLFKASALRQRWDGFMVCSDDWETRHPQDFVRGVADIQAPRWTRPESADRFIISAPTTVMVIDSFNLTDYAGLTRGFEAANDTTTLSDTISLSKTFVITETLSLIEAISVPGVTFTTAYAVNGAAVNVTRMN